MDKKIEKDMGETVEVVKHGRPCLQDRCYLGRTGLCKHSNGKWYKECEWDLRDMRFDVQKQVREAEVDKKIRGKEIPRRNKRTAES